MFEKLGVIVIVLLLTWFIWELEFRETFQANHRLRKSLEHLVDRANNGNESAQHKCDNSCYINKRMVLCDDGINLKTHYSVAYDLI